MRYSHTHKQETRSRIVKAAARRFRARGSEGAAIAGVMRELHLTHGGFYRHFPTKSALFNEALSEALREVGDRLEAAVRTAPADQRLAALIGAYLTAEHCDHPEAGCPIAALGADLARLPKAARSPMRRAIDGYAERMAQYLPGATAAERARRAAVLFSSMAGTLTVARTITDTSARERLLADARTFFSNAWSS